MRIGVAVTALLSALAFASTAAGAARQPRTCLVSNGRTDVGMKALQPAIDAAAPGDTLVVKGTCVGAVTIDRNLTVKGVGNKAFGAATIDGNDTDGSVLTIQDAVTVTLAGLTITHGGAGIFSEGNVALTESSVTGNAGIGIFGDGSMTLDGADVVDNGGDGISNTAGTVSITDSLIGGNGGAGVSLLDSTFQSASSTVSDNGASGIVDNINSLVVLSDSTVSGNSSTGDGGGIYVGNSFLELDNSSVTGNTAHGNGGGIYVGGGFVTVTDSSVTGNTASGAGGGIFFDTSLFGSVTLSGSTTVSGNLPDQCVAVSGC